MSTPHKYRDTFCKRLKNIRLERGLSQKELGKLAGIDEFVASTRINRYEQGIHEADIETAGKLAQALAVPLAYFYADNDKLAEMILLFDEDK
ncbi:helix-turn-helix transcriptional regulator [Orbus sturtevantii]|uniref:helix-turn-helix domain-containing protein n=1 Tax=Orbus sturtevantii TaxID=3074109 RepID=UPI00370D27BE